MTALLVYAMKDTLGQPVTPTLMNAAEFHLFVKGEAYAPTLMEASPVHVQTHAQVNVMLVVATPVPEEATV